MNSAPTIGCFAIFAIGSLLVGAIMGQMWIPMVVIVAVGVLSAIAISK